MKRTPSQTIKPGGVDEYIACCREDVQGKLRTVRKAIQETAPDAIETVSYFDIPGYSYPGYDYNGMFAWFSFSDPTIRLHLRPPVIEGHKKQLVGYKTTKAIVSFPIGKEIPTVLIKKLVRASLAVMRAKKAA